MVCGASQRVEILVSGCGYACDINKAGRLPNTPSRTACPLDSPKASRVKTFENDWDDDSGSSKIPLGNLSATIRSAPFSLPQDGLSAAPSAQLHIFFLAHVKLVLASSKAGAERASDMCCAWPRASEYMDRE